MPKLLRLSQHQLKGSTKTLHYHWGFRFWVNFEKVFYTSKYFLVVYTVECAVYMKKALIYTVVIFTLLSLSVAMIPHVSAVEGLQSIKILSYTHYIDSIGVLDVVGEIQNTGSVSVKDIYLTGIVKGPDGTEIGRSQCQVSGQYIVPQGKASFLMEFSQSPNGIGSWATTPFSSIELTLVKATPTNQHEYSDFSLTDLSYYIDNVGNNSGVYWATGKVTNTGNQNAQGVIVFATFYNASGAVIGVGYTDSKTLSPTTLSPGGTATFKVGPWDLNMYEASSERKVANYNLLVQVTGPIINDTGAPPTVPPTATFGPSSSPPPQDDSGGNQISSSSNQWLIYVAIIIIVIVAVVAAIVTRPRRKVENKKLKSKRVPSKSTQNKPLRQISLQFFIIV
jgi:hypothetical protein